MITHPNAIYSNLKLLLKKDLTGISVEIPILSNDGRDYDYLVLEIDCVMGVNGGNDAYLSLWPNRNTANSWSFYSIWRNHVLNTKSTSEMKGTGTGIVIGRTHNVVTSKIWSTVEIFKVKSIAQHIHFRTLCSHSPWEWDDNLFMDGGGCDTQNPSALTKIYIKTTCPAGFTSGRVRVYGMHTNPVVE